MRKCAVDGCLTDGRHSMSASIDHIVPLSAGGLHCRSNVQLAHFGCNAKKNNKTRREQNDGVV
jgi:5-methylcytosine-specific restriction endonuclease McrA